MAGKRTGDESDRAFRRRFDRRGFLRTAGSAIPPVAVLGRTGPASAQTSVGGSERWRFETGDAVMSSPTVVDGVVYVGSNDGNLYTLDAASGEEEWRFDAGSAVRSSPAVVDGVVYVGGYDETVYALDAASGEERWRFEIEVPFSMPSMFSSPTVGTGDVYVGSTNGNVYALDATSGDERWRFETHGEVQSSPAVTDATAVTEGTVYVGSYDKSVYALDAASGEERWRRATDAPPFTGVWSSPTVVDGVVYVGSNDSYVYALDAAGGGERWRFETGSSVRSSPTVAGRNGFVGSSGGGSVGKNGVVYVGSSDGNVYALDAASGEERWRIGTPRIVFSSPTVAGGIVYVGSDAVYAIDAPTGFGLWRFETGGAVRSSPTVVDGVVYVGSDDGNLYALDAGVSGWSEGSRVQLRTLGHHDEGWRRSNPDATTDSGDDELGLGVGVAGVLGGLGGIGYLLRRRLDGENAGAG